MISIFENRFNTKLLHALSQLNLLPIQYANEGYKLGGHIKYQTSPWRLWIWRVLFGLYTIHVVYITVRLVQCLKFRELWVTEHFPIHVFWVIVGVVFQTFAYTIFVQWPGFTVEVCNAILENLRGSLKKTRKIMTMSLQELLAIFMPVVTCGNYFVLCGAMAIDGTRLQLVYSAVPKAYQTFPVFFSCALFESFCIAYFCSIGYFLLWCHLLFFEMTNSRLFSLTSDVRRSRQFKCSDAIEKFSQLRHIQLHLQFFNECNGFLIFYYKILCILFGVIGGYVLVRFGQKDIVLGAVCSVGLASAFSFYGLIYDKAFKIPKNIELLKDQIQLATARLKEPALLKRVVKLLMSIPPVGIRVGDFHKMERVSTLIFVDFVVGKVVNLLVTY